MAEIIVLGAGMVGISSALALQARGHTVTVLDRREPGLETTYGNAGIIQREAVEPYNIPHDPVKLFLYGIGQTNDIVYHWRDMPKLLPALAAYFSYSGAEKHRAISKIYEQMIVRVTDDHAPLVEASGADYLISRDGFLTLCRDQKGYDLKAAEADYLQANYDAPLRMVDGAEVKSMEPALKKDVVGAVHWTDSWACSDPGALTQAYGTLFVKNGGRIVKGDAMSLSQQGAGWSVNSEEGEITASDVVVALGPWSPDLLERFGYRIKMVWKRGYHGHFEMEKPLSRPVQDFANGVVWAPMTGGLRIATGAELVRRDGPDNYKQLMHGLKAAKDMLDVGEEIEGGRWHGNRPCMPDMLPVVGKAPKHEGLWFQFGHGHQGLTLGPTTANILADLVSGKSDAISDALDPARRPVISH